MAHKKSAHTAQTPTQPNGQVQAARAESDNTRAAFQAETRRALQDRHALARSKVQQLQTDQAKATQRHRHPLKSNRQRHPPLAPSQSSTKDIV